MANQPFDREVWNLRERPISVDNNQEATYADLALREVLRNIFNTRVSASNDAGNTNPPTSFFGEAFKVRPGGGLAVRLVKGIGFFGDVSNQPVSIGGLVGVNDFSAMKPLVLSQDEFITVPPNPSADPRIDIIEVKYRTALVDSTNRDIMTGVAPFVFAPNLVNKTLTWNLLGQQGTVTTPAPSTAFIGYKVGIPAASPIAPTLTAGYEKIGEVFVGAGAVAILINNITDYRRIYAPYGRMEIEFVISIVPSTGVVTLLGFSGPPGMEPPTILASAEDAQGRIVFAWSVVNAFGDSNKVMVQTEMDNSVNDNFPVCVNRAINGSSGQIQSMIFNTDPPLALATPPRVAHPNPSIYRTKITFW